MKETLKDTGKVILIGVFLKSKNLVNFYRQCISPPPGVVLFFFYLNDFQFDKLVIRGAFYDSNRRCWANEMFPLPHVLYLRDGVARSERNRFELFLKVISSSGVKLVNSLPEFDKWDLHRVLHPIKELRPHIPETRLYRKDSPDLEQMLEQYGSVYLKACRGRQGRQVVRLNRMPGGFCEYRHFSGKLVIRRGRLESSLFRDAIAVIFNDAPLIIQQPIELIVYGGRKVDLRAEMQRSGRGELEVVAIPVRIAMDRSPITTHSSSYRFKQFFSGMMNYNDAEFEELISRVHDFLFTVYKNVEERYGPFGEIGIDFGLDRAGRLWFIECNSQPAKVSLAKAYGSDTITRAYANPLRYALFIARSMLKVQNSEFRMNDNNAYTY